MTARKTPRSQTRAPRAPNKGGSSDTVLIERARGGDDAAKAELTKKYMKFAVNVARRRLRNYPDLAHDAANRALAKAWKKLDTFTGKAKASTTARLPERTTTKFSTWLWHVIDNEALDIWRKQNKIAQREGGQLEDDQGETRAEAATEATAARQAETLDLLKKNIPYLETLPKRQQDVLVGRFKDGLSYKEMAAKYNMPIGSVMSALYRAKAALKMAPVQNPHDGRVVYIECEEDVEDLLECGIIDEDEADRLFEALDD